MPPLVSIVGTSNTGKTTLVVKIVGELKSRGYRVASAKHAMGGTTLDTPGKDTWRHIEAGSEAVVVMSKQRTLLLKPAERDITLDDIPGILGEDYDIIIAEGFKTGNAPKIEVHRKEAAPPLKNVKDLVAIATDEPLDTDVRQIPLEDVKGICDLIENEFIVPAGKERLALYINGKKVTLTDYPRNIITKLVMAMATSLKRVGRPKNIRIHLVRK